MSIPEFIRAVCAGIFREYGSCHGKGPVVSWFHIVKSLWRIDGRAVQLRLMVKDGKQHMEEQNKNPIQVAGRLFGAMEYLAEHGASSLMEVANTLELNKSTAHRILTSLQYMGYVRQNEEDSRYELSYKVVQLSSLVISRMDIINKVRPYLRKLMELSGETVHFVKREGAEVVYIDKVESTRNAFHMVSRIGSRIPVYRSAVGKAIASTMKESDVQELWEESDITRATPYTITEYREFLRTLEEVRDRGYALDNEENEVGVRCIGAALEIPGCGSQYAFSISAPVGRMDNERIEELSRAVLATKADIEQAI